MTDLIRALGVVRLSIERGNTTGTSRQKEIMSVAPAARGRNIVGLGGGPDGFGVQDPTAEAPRPHWQAGHDRRRAGRDLVLAPAGVLW